MCVVYCATCQSNLILFYHILSYLILSYLILSYLILSYLILSYLILSNGNAYIPFPFLKFLQYRHNCIRADKYTHAYIRSYRQTDRHTHTQTHTRTYYLTILQPYTVIFNSRSLVQGPWKVQYSAHYNTRCT